MGLSVRLCIQMQMHILYKCVVCNSYVCVCVCVCVAVARQAPLPIGFSRQESWSGLPVPSRDLPDPGIKPGSPILQADSLSSRPSAKPITIGWSTLNKLPLDSYIDSMQIHLGLGRVFLGT